MLHRRQQRVNRSPDPKAAAASSWRSFGGTAAAVDVRATLRAMCSGLVRCMYCEDNEATDIEHWRPKAGYPEYSFTWENYLLACKVCNSNHKRDAFPLSLETGRPLLIDPTTMDPFDHLALSATSGMYVALDEIGAASIEVFGLNRDICVLGRRHAWVNMCTLIEHYPTESGAKRRAISELIRDYPYQGVRRWLGIVFESGDRATVLSPEVKFAVTRHPELVSHHTES